MPRILGTYTAIVTPFTSTDGSIDLARLEEHIRFQAAGGVTGIVPCGQTEHGVTSLVDLGWPVTMDEADAALKAMVADSADLRRVIASPLLARAQQQLVVDGHRGRARQGAHK